MFDLLSLDFLLFTAFILIGCIFLCMWYDDRDIKFMKENNHSTIVDLLKALLINNTQTKTNKRLQKKWLTEYRKALELEEDLNFQKMAIDKAIEALKYKDRYQMTLRIVRNDETPEEEPEKIKFCKRLLDFCWIFCYNAIILWYFIVTCTRCKRLFVNTQTTYSIRRVHNGRYH